MKERDLKPCEACGRALTHDGSPLFYRITIESLILDPGAIQRRIGLGLAMGSHRLAQVMGPDEDLARTVVGPRSFLLCLPCAVKALGALVDPAADPTSSVRVCRRCGFSFECPSTTADGVGDYFVDPDLCPKCTP